MVDPTYPLYPIVGILSATLSVLIFVNSFCRSAGNLNLGVALLCAWLLLENLTGGVNAIVWSDNAEVRLYAYCDIVSRINLVCPLAKSAATLIMMRRLKWIAGLRSIESLGRTQRAWRTASEWALASITPLLIAGPFYYVVQSTRFQVLEGFGCTYAVAPSILTFLLVHCWTILPSLLSLTLYYPTVVTFFYRHHKDANRFALVSRLNYIRVLAISSLDVFLFLPLNIAMLVMILISASEDASLTFYPGWNTVHMNWHPITVSYSALKLRGPVAVAVPYFARWASPVIALITFGLFGLTAESRASYCRLLCMMRRRERPLSAIDFVYDDPLDAHSPVADV